MESLTISFFGKDIEIPINGRAERQFEKLHNGKMSYREYLRAIAEGQPVDKIRSKLGVTKAGVYYVAKMRVSPYLGKEPVTLNQIRFETPKKKFLLPHIKSLLPKMTRHVWDEAEKRGISVEPVVRCYSKNASQTSTKRLFLNGLVCQLYFMKTAQRLSKNCVYARTMISPQMLERLDVLFFVITIGKRKPRIFIIPVRYLNCTERRSIFFPLKKAKPRYIIDNPMVKKIRAYEDAWKHVL